MDVHEYNAAITEIKARRALRLSYAKGLKLEQKRDLKVAVAEWFNTEELLIASTHDAYRFRGQVAQLKGRLSAMEETDPKFKEVELDLAECEKTLAKVTAQAEACDGQLSEVREAAGIGA